MQMLATLLVVFVGLLHVAFMAWEMFYWTHPSTLKSLQMSAEVAEGSKVLAANQGFYNGLFAAGLFGSLALVGASALALQVYILGAIVLAGIYGAATASKQILLVQAIPAALALAAVCGAWFAAG